MKKTYTLLLGLLALLALVSCAEDAIMTFYNDTETTTDVQVENVLHQLPPYSTLERKWNLSRSLFQLEEMIVYVNIREKPFLFPTHYSVKLQPGSRIHKKIKYNAGTLTIVNYTNLPIYEVYITPAGESFWGSNRLTEPIQPDRDKRWNIAPGLWDIKVLYHTTQIMDYYDMRFYIGHSNIIYIPGSKTTKNPSREKFAGDSLSSNQELLISPLD
jgi:hypothetical protein